MDNQNLVALLSRMLGPQAATFSPMPGAQMSPVVPMPIRPAALAQPQSPAPQSAGPGPEAAPQPYRLGPPGAELPQAPAPRPADDLTARLADQLGGEDAGGGTFSGMLDDFAGGMARDASSRSPIGAFGAGFSGSRATTKARADEAHQRKRQARQDARDDEAWNWKREDRDIDADERDFQRGRTVRSDEREEETHRESRKAGKIELVKKVLDIQRAQIELDPSYVSTDLKKTILDGVDKHIRSFAESNLFSTPEQLNAEAARKRQELEEYFGIRKPAPAAPETEAPAQPPAEPAPNGSEIPMVGAPPNEAVASGAPQSGIPRVSSLAEAMKLPKGTKFYTPDGRLKVVP